MRDSALLNITHRRVRYIAAAALLVGLAIALGLWLVEPSVVRADAPPHLGYGMVLAYPPGHLDRVRTAGFDWFKYYVDWAVVDADQDRTYVWDTVDWRLDEACEQGLNVLLRVERGPADWTPVQDAEMALWETFFRDLAEHIAAKRATCSHPYRVALEVWNEPNLDFQWTGQPIDPVRYTEMVKRAYRGAKAGDPHILVVAGGLAPTGGMADGHAMDDVAFLEAMYDAGVQGHFDVLSVHNYGYGGRPVVVDPVAGDSDTSFTVAVDPRGLPLGTYATTLTLTAEVPEATDSPLLIPVHTIVVPKVYETHLPLVQR